MKGLVWEWSYITEYYNLKKQDDFNCPAFSFSESSSYIASWNRSRYEISINRDFFYNSTWYEIRYVLKHEIAHQYADIVLNGMSESAHGDSFRQACEKLKIRNSARYNKESDLDKGRPDFGIINKIKKLFSLASSSNKYEAETAMEKAHELMFKYNLKFFDSTFDEYVSKPIGRPGLRHGKDISLLTSLLSRFYFVYPIWIPVFIKDNGKPGKILEITGKKENIEIASYVYDFVLSYINSAWLKFRFENPHVRYGKGDFSFGIIKGFSDKLSKISEEKYPHIYKGLPIAVTTDPKLENFINWSYPGLKTVKSVKVNLRKNLYDEGVKKGRELVINKGIRTNSEQPVFYIKKNTKK